MIYTITFNPSLDYIVSVDNFQCGIVNRTKAELLFAGGKGINVSMVLSNLGYETTALGFVAGFTGEKLQSLLKEKNITTDFISVEQGMSRINVKLRSQEETEINGMGPEITKQHIEQLFQKLEKLQDGDILVLAGSVPESMSSDIYMDIMKKVQEVQEKKDIEIASERKIIETITKERVRDKEKRTNKVEINECKIKEIQATEQQQKTEAIQKSNIRVVVDATKDLLKNVLPYRPFLIKPNHHELGELFGKVLTTQEEIIVYAKELQKQGARNVLVSMAKDGAILIAEDGNVYVSKAPKGVVKNSVGAGDSMVAGFLAGFLTTGDYKEALKYGICTGSASAFSDNLATKKEVEELLKQVTEEK